MEKVQIMRLHANFEDAKYEENDLEFWLARELRELLGYKSWDGFANVLIKAIDSCNGASQKVSDHFRQVTKTIDMPKGASREITEFMLTRYACYLVAQNGDSKKTEIAFAQNYFAIQTRKMELVEKRIALSERLHHRVKLSETERKFSDIIYERDVNGRDFGIIRSRGDEALFGGYSTSEMKTKFQIPKGRPLADFLPTITIKAKDFATEISSFNIEKDELHGKLPISREHIRNNKEVRKLLIERGIKPEDLPPEEDIRKAERRIKSDEKKLLKQ
ncbi:MAG: DNA damage-inducible protein D [FCB group bacterium]|nr:DNA damage-inducible protein D [FCB group bacterium]